jgi:hypothetical protein
VARNADAAARGNAFESCSDVHTVAEDIAAILDNVTYVDAHPEFNAPVRTDLRIACGHPALNFYGTSYSIDHARKLDEDPIPGRLKNASMVLLDFGIAERAPMCLQGGERAFFIGGHQLTIACDVGRKDRYETAFDVLPHRSGSACLQARTYERSHGLSIECAG